MNRLIISLLILFISPAIRAAQNPIVISDSDFGRLYFNEDFEILPLEKDQTVNKNNLFSFSGFQPFSLEFLKGKKSKNLVRFKVQNDYAEALEVYFGSNQLEYIEGWVKFKDTLVGPLKGGHLLASKEKQIQIEGMSFLKAAIPASESADFYLLFENKTASTTPQNTVPPSIFSSSFFRLNFEKFDTYTALFYGTTLSMALFNLLLFLLNPFRAYLYYTLYILSVVCFISSLNPIFAYSNFGHMDINTPPISNFGIMGLAFIPLVGKELLRTRENFPKINKILNVLIGFLAFSMLGAIFPSLLFAGIIINFTSALFIYPALIVLGAILFYKKDKAGTYFFFASAVFLISQTILVIQMIGWIDYNFLNLTPQIFTQLGTMSEFALFSLGIGHLYNQNKAKLNQEELQKEQILKEKEIKKRSLVESKNQRMENLLKERTSQISEKSDALKTAYENLQKMQHQLIESEKMASLGQFTAGVAAEIKDPINFVANGVNNLEANSLEIIEAINNYDQLDPKNYQPSHLEEVLKKNEKLHLKDALDDFEDLFSTVKNGVNRTVKIVTSLRNFSRLDEYDYKMADLHDGLDATIDIMQSQFKGDISIQSNYSEEVPKIFCYPGKLNQAFMSIINQCVNELQGEGSIQLSTNLENTDMILVKFLHNGKSLGAAEIEILNQDEIPVNPLSTQISKLINAKRIAKEHDGKLTYQVESDGRCGFSLYIPVRHS
ncbi:MAG: 7TM diverse intracellular signaling domain-containing protein [Saprospiraceae bacterium]